MKRPSLDTLLHIDGYAALIVGILLLAGRNILSGLLQLPSILLTVQGLINLAYSAWSLPLALSKTRPDWKIRLLIGGNLAYACLVVVLIFYYYGQYNLLGALYFLSEIIIIGGMGLLERSAMAEGENRSDG